MTRRACLALLFSLTLGFAWPAGASTCLGTTANGALEDGCRLPSDGPNFSPYSRLGIWLGRTYVHCTVAEVVESAYRLLDESHPDKSFVYGESGPKSGGQFKPHKTHQNGLSVDFMVPVVNESGESIPLPTGLTNKFGYDLEFDSEGRLDDLRIDYEAMAAHIEALKVSAESAGIGIWRVLFDPQLQPGLRKSARWSAIQDLQFSQRRSWVRHDEHYHVDFEVACEPHEEGG